MSPFDMAVFAMPISFIIAILPGPPGMASAAATDLPMFSPVQAIIAADAGLIANAMAIVAGADRPFILFSPSAAECRFDNDNQWARFRHASRVHALGGCCFKSCRISEFGFVLPNRATGRRRRKSASGTRP